MSQKASAAARSADGRSGVLKGPPRIKTARLGRGLIPGQGFRAVPRSP